MKAFSRILLTGGGTAGHVNPALAIGRALGDGRTAYLYVGVRGRAEAEIVPREGIPIRFVRASAYPGAPPSLAWLGFTLNLIAGTTRALFLVRSFAPEIIVGTGGYASAPTMLAAAILRRLGLISARVYVHEQNAAPGKLNLLIGRLADRVFVSFADTLAEFPRNGVMAGYPLRRRIQKADREAQVKVIKDGAKMSKSKGNVVDPDFIITKYGADTARLFSLFAAPPERDLEWDDQGVDGAYWFLHRIWAITHKYHGRIAGVAPADPSVQGDSLFRKTHLTIKKVTEDIERQFQFNTAIAAMMELVNELYAFCDQKGCVRTGRRGEESDEPIHVDAASTRAVLKEAIETLLLLLSPFAPHMAEELWAA